MKLKEKKVYQREKTHFFESGLLIQSKGRKLFFHSKKSDTEIKMPFRFIDIFIFSRLLRRLLRLDQCNIIPSKEGDNNFIVIRGSIVYLLDKEKEQFKVLFKLKQCRNLLFNSHCYLEDGKLLIGEYGFSNNQTVPFYLINLNNFSYKELDLFGDVNARHVHCIRRDPYTNNIWICTGDFHGECHLFVFSSNLELIEIIGDGGQLFRTCDLIFLKNEVVWLMDSPIEEPYVISYDRKSRKINKLQRLEGPVWHICKLRDYYIAAVSVEPGKSVRTEYAQLLVSNDGKDWTLIEKYKKDIFPWIFKFAVLEICKKEENDFYINFQSTSNNDGKSVLYNLVAS